MSAAESERFLANIAPTPIALALVTRLLELLVDGASCSIADAYGLRAD
jgi:hypothetical protein